MHEYSAENSRFEPKIRDFGDEYHLPDVEDLVSDDIMTRVKKIRRRYQNWYDYTDACQLYDQYMEDLFDKYGGKNGFKIAFLLGKVREYIPNYPELRKNKKNRVLAKVRASRPLEVEPSEFEKTPIEEIMKIETPKVSVKLNGSKKVDEIFYSRSRAACNFNVEQIATDLDMLQSYYQRRKERIERMKGKKKKKNKLIQVINRKQMKIASNYRSLEDMIRLDEKRRVDKFMNKTSYAANSLYDYKGRMISSAKIEVAQTMDQLKSIGVKFNNISKKQTKLIKKKKLSKKEMKKNKKQERDFINKFCNDEYEDFRQFEDEMMNLTGSRRFD